MKNISYGLDGKVAVVTGGTRGIGLELARELLRQKAKVVICGRKEEGLQKAVDDLAGGDNLLAVQAHVAKEKDVDNLFDKAIEKFSTVDILINNVGMNLPTPPLSDIEPSMWNKIIESNLNGAFFCSRRAAKIMKEKNSGKIVSITSVAAHKASPGMGVYGIAKSGIEMMTKVLASEMAFFKVNVNAVAPAMVRTDFSKPFWSNSDIHDHVIKSIPMGRIAEIEEVVHPVLFLVSDGAAFITGQTLLVDGGSTVI